MTTQEVTHSLAAYLRRTGYFAATEVPLLTNGVSPAATRADVYAIRLGSFTRKDTAIYEVKVSRADFLQDVRTGKALGYTRFAHKVSYAVPEGLVDRMEVPPGIGLLTLSGDAWAPQQTARPIGDPGEPTVDLMLLLMRRGLEEAQAA